MTLCVLILCINRSRKRSDNVDKHLFIFYILLRDLFFKLTSDLSVIVYLLDHNESKQEQKTDKHRYFAAYLLKEDKNHYLYQTHSDKYKKTCRRISVCIIS